MAPHERIPPPCVGGYGVPTGCRQHGFGVEVGASAFSDRGMTIMTLAVVPEEKYLPIVLHEFGGFRTEIGGLSKRVISTIKNRARQIGKDFQY